MLRALIVVRLKGLLSSMFGRMFQSGKKRGPVFKVLVGLLFVYVLGAFMLSMGMYFVMMAGPLAGMGLDWLYFGLAGLMAVMLNFVGSVFITQSQLFTARDNELLLSMPIPPGYILVSRMATLLALNYLYTLLVMLPAGVVWAMEAGMTPTGAVGLVAGVVFLPLLSMSLSCVCGWLVGLITSRMRRSGLMSLVLFVVFFGGYAYLFAGLQGYLGRLIENGAAIGEAVRRAMPPVYWFGAGATGDLAGMALFILCCILPFALVYGLISRSFVTILTTKKGAPRVKYRARAMKTASAGAALLRRELGRFLGTPIYILNSGFGAVMHLVMAVALIWKGPALMATLAGMSLEGLEGLLPGVACVAICFCSIMVVPSAASVSLEGKNLWIVKTAPVSTRQIFRAKVGVNLLASVPTGLVASLACLWVLPCPPLVAVAIVALPVAASLFIALLGLSANLALPRLDWISEAVVVKQSASVLIAMLGGMATVGLPVMLYLVWLHRVMALDVYLLACMGLLLALCGGLWIFLRRRGVALFEALS